jgi:hypothetical protein
MRKIFISVTVFTLFMVSAAFAGDIIGRHKLQNDQGVVTVKSLEGNKMAFEAIYVPAKGRLVILTNVFADYNPQTRKATYSEDRFCPGALEIKFQKSGKVILQEAVCAVF